MTTREEWLAGLKVGDEVAVKGWGVRAGWTSMLRVSHITPTRLIDVSGTRYRNGCHDEKWGGLRLVEPTAKVRAKIKRTAQTMRLHQFLWASLSDSQLDRVCAILDEAKP